MLLGYLIKLMLRIKTAIIHHSSLSLISAYDHRPRELNSMEETNLIAITTLCHLWICICAYLT